MHESTTHEYEHIPHDHSIYLICGILDCHKLLSIFMVQTDSLSSMHSTSKKDQWVNGSMDQWITEWLWSLGRMAL